MKRFKLIHKPEKFIALGNFEVFDFVMGCYHKGNSLIKFTKRMVFYL